MDRLVSLKERPATKEDIGKAVYFISALGEVLAISIPPNYKDFNSGAVYNCYWNEPTLVSKSYYEQMQEDLKEAREIIKKYLYGTSGIVGLDKQAREFLEKQSKGLMYPKDTQGGRE